MSKRYWKLLAEAFHQHSATKKEYITPVMKQSKRKFLDSIRSEKRVYGNKLAEPNKKPQAIRNACQNVKGTEKLRKDRFYDFKLREIQIIS